ncbi:Swi5-domain-containing protein [Fomitopsis serialis]|uniref:Swi5-domain-containing protein n=1 Tax=Fomitopsis serialis TaxID=139415 RepID=UPI00200755BB|nr:Swi5-domain-containing protein [Neoantrodia serialis]KAH9926497.1 Swi5-domain-containing protein [Neoantrodia serialis]
MAKKAAAPWLLPFRSVASLSPSRLSPAIAQSDITLTVTIALNARRNVREGRQQQERIAALQAEVDELQQKLGESEDAGKLVSRHIKLLHRYNEAKDAAQILMGRLAANRQTTIRQIHKDYGLTQDD